MKYIIIGGVAGGATAAARIRRADEESEIIIFEKGKYISYANCGLPYYIGGTIAHRDSLFLQSPEAFKKQLNIDVRVESEVLSIDVDNKQVLVKTVDGKEYKENFDKLLLSSGSTAVRPPLEGIDSDGIFTLKDVNDTDKIKQYTKDHVVKKAVVVGAGFIGLEMAENLHELGAEVSIVEMGNQVMAPLDFSMAAKVHEHLLEKDVNLYLEETVEKFSKDGDQLKVHFKSGEVLTTDIVILSIGVRPLTKLAKDASLKIGETGGIWVNEYLETSAKDIYAVGDAIEFPHPITGKPWLNYLANPANRQGRIVADNMVFGNKQTYEGAIGTSIAKVFDLTVASTGLPAKRLKQLNIPYLSSWTHGQSHVTYYPGAMPLSIKITFDPGTGQLYGAQSVGYEGIDKRIDQIALLIKNKKTIYELIQLEQCYAPPYSAAKDPIAIAGYVANNIINKSMSIITWSEFKDLDKSAVTLLDVRTKDEHLMSPVEGSINIPLEEIRERINEIPKDKPVVIFCAVGLRGYLTSKILLAKGYSNVRNLSGGYRTYSTAIAPTKKIKKEVADSSVKLTSFQYPAANKSTDATEVVKIDACGLQCPGPVMRLKQSIDSMAQGQRLEIISTDAGFARDAEAWCSSTGNTFISSTSDKGKFTIIVEKGEGKKAVAMNTQGGKGKTFIMFSDDLDKALATFVLANGAAATGEKVTIFFTFWGLNTIKKVDKPKVEKDIFGKMFSMMLPSSSKQLKLSKMNMWGMGRRMMRYIMKHHGIDSLESLREQALQNGVEFIACQMSMDVMGVKKEELLDEVTIGGVATYMERADNANVNLFV